MGTNADMCRTLKAVLSRLAVATVITCWCSFPAAAQPGKSDPAGEEQTLKEERVLGVLLDSLENDENAQWSSPESAWRLRQFREYTRLMSRELGLDFAERHPGNSHTWRWLRNTVQYEGMLASAPTWDELTKRLADHDEYSPIVDKNRHRDWKKRFDTVKRDCLADPATPVDVRFALLMWPLYFEVQQALIGGKAASDYDWVAAADRLYALGERFKDIHHKQLLRICMWTLMGADGGEPRQVAQSIRDKLRRSGHPLIVAAASQDRLTGQLSVKPLEFAFSTLRDGTIDLHQLRGQVVLIKATGITWCGACKVQEKYMAEVYDKYKNAGFQMITVAMEPSADKQPYVEKYIEKHHMTWPHVLEVDGPGSVFRDKFAITGAPEYFLLDKAGHLIARTKGSEGITHLEEVLRPLLGMPPLSGADELKQLGK